MRTHSRSLALWLAVASGTVFAQEPGLAPSDFYREVTVEEVAVSPDGELVAFTVMSIVEEENTRHREIWFQRIEDGRPADEPYRATSPVTESSAPRFSPDGGLLAFQSRRGDDEDASATWFLRTRGPAGEAFAVDGVRGEPVWSPDGRWIAFVAEPHDDGQSDEPEGEREGWIAPDAISNTLDAERFDGRVITSMRYKRDGRLPLQPHFSTRSKRQLFVVPAEGGEPVQLTRADFDVSQVVWSADGDELYFVGDRRQDDETNRVYTRDIFLVSRDGGEARALTTNPGHDFAPSVSPDGRSLAYLHTRERGAETDVYVVALADNGAFAGTPSNRTPGWDLGPREPSFSADGSAIRFSATVGGNQHVFEVPASGGEVRATTTGDRRISSPSWSRDDSAFAYAATDAVTPQALYVGDIKATRFNEGWLGEVTLVPPERLTWQVADGSTIEGWVVKPVGYEPGKRYPMILKIHGGPHGAYGNTFFRTFHILSARGFFVLYPNPRGSTGYGHAFTYKTRAKWGEMDSEDYLGGVDAALAKYPDIDPDRIGVSGGSYGGFMTNWLSATTDRFAAAVTSRSITNWESWYGTSDAQGLTEYEFLGPPWEQRELYRRLSPISYVENVDIPTLIIHSEQDWRTPIGDGEQWFMALKKRGVPVEMVRYPRSSHGLSRTGEPWLLVDRLERLASWFTHFLIDSPRRATTEQP